MAFFTQPIFIGIAMVTLLYFIWITMSGIGLKGVTQGQDIKDIRQEGGLSLLILTFLSLVIFWLYFYLRQTPTPLPFPA